MPIKGLTDRGPQFPQIGELRKGAPKTEGRIGKDLDYFRFTTTDPEVAAEFREIYGDQPRQVRVLLPFATPDQNFTAWREEWKAGGLIHRCDGETMILYRVGAEYHTEARPCPYLNLPKAKRLCKPVGRLKVVIPELQRLAYVLMATTSQHDIANLSSQLEALYLLRGKLNGIPLILSRQLKSISTPADDGRRVRRDKWLLSLEADPGYVRLELAAQQAAALPQLTATVTPTPPGYVIMPDGEIVNAPEDEGEDEDEFQEGDTPNLSKATAEDLYGPVDEAPEVDPETGEIAEPAPEGGYPTSPKTLFAAVNAVIPFYNSVGHMRNTLRKIANQNFEWPGEPGAYPYLYGELIGYARDNAKMPPAP